MAVIKPSNHRIPKCLNSRRKFLHRRCCTAKGFYDLHSIHIFHHCSSHCFAIFCVFLEHSHHIFSRHHHPINEKTKNQGSERGQGKLPAYGKHINDDNCKAKDMGSQLREHMCQRVFQMFDFIHKNFFILASIALCCLSH